jgi:hypothetical protein
MKAEGKMTPSLCLHLLHLYGLEETFPYSDVESGTKLLDMLTNDRIGQPFFGVAPLIRTRSGIRFQGEPGLRASESHRDQCLASFGELGLPLSYPLLVDGQNHTLRDVLCDSVANFHLKQAELNWTALAYILYLPPSRKWVNRYGEQYSFDDVVRNLLHRPLS